MLQIRGVRSAMSESASSTGAVVGTREAATADAAGAWPPRARAVVALGLILLGGLALEWRLGDAPEIVVAWLVLGAVAGAVAGRARLAWIAVFGGLALYPLGVALGLAPRLGPWWFVQAGFAAIIVALGFALGATSSPGRRPWSVAGGSWARARAPQRAAAALAIAVPLLGLGGYMGYAAAVGSAMFTHPDPDRNCTTPQQAFGWPYEAINYDIADDARLAAANPDPKACSSQGAEAGTAVVSPDGMRLAGWYIAAAGGADPTGPTIVLVHGWHSNKSAMLPYAAPLHDRFNLVLVDLRDNGRSSPTDVTMGVREQTDLEAVIDWLVATKHPAWIAAVGNSMGGATVLAAASHDERIKAVVLESTHASLITSGGNIAENQHGYPAQPTGLAIAIGASLRIGADVTAIDPVRMITRLGDRPVLIIHGTADDVDYPVTSAEVNLHAALEAGVPASLVYCPGGTHGRSVDACPRLWSSSANAFFAEAASR
jgi:pimeloyl-ACP methyl ester carboxylesterase